MKRCSACGEAKPADQFHADRSKEDGRTSTCKVCARARSSRRYYKKVREPAIADRAEKRRRKRGPGYVRGVTKHCRRCKVAKPWDAFRDEPRALDGKASACTDCLNAANRASWIKKRKASNAARRSWTERNPERERKRVKNWHAEHPDRIREVKRRSRSKRRQDNPAIVNAATRAYRARKLAAPGACSNAQLSARIEYYGARCWICRGPWMAIDHVKPLTMGGSEWPANLRPICNSCNARKSNRWPFPTSRAEATSSVTDNRIADGARQ